MILFSRIWQRIKEETDLNTLIELGKFVESSKPTVARKKAEDNFPVEWAYKIGKKYNLLTEWILEGTGPKRPGNVISSTSETKSTQNNIVNYIDQWITELAAKDDRKITWFEVQFENKFPEFEEWKRKKLEEERENTILQEQNIA